jgi:ATP-binding cassette subfamily B protein
MWRYAYMADDGAKPRITWKLVRRVLSYARPYQTMIIIGLILILIQSGIGLLTPLIVRDLLDRTLPTGDAQRLNVLAFGLILIPIFSSIIGIIIRRVNARIGEGVIYDLRVSLFSHLQRMSLRFFTNTKSGELMSRLNNDVVNAQTAISDTIVGIITNAVQLIATLGVMFALDWRLTLLGVLVFPLFVISARAIGTKLRDIAREAMNLNAEMNAIMVETLNISGALLVKLFGRRNVEVDRFAQRAGRVRDIGVRRAVLGSQFWALLGGAGVIGSALVYWLGGHLVLEGAFTIGTLVAFGAYLGQLYGPMQYLVDVPVEFSTSMVSFERVFEIIDLPEEIVEKPDALALKDVSGKIVFDDVTFRYAKTEDGLLSEVKRFGRGGDMPTLSASDKPKLVMNTEGAKPTLAR